MSKDVIFMANIYHLPAKRDVKIKQYSHTKQGNIYILNEKFREEQQKDGILGRSYNLIKNITGIGIGSDKIQESIKKYQENEITRPEIENQIKKYKMSQENALQGIGDFVSSAVTLGMFFNLRNKLKNKIATFAIKPKGFLDFVKSTPKFIIVVLPFLALAGSITKYAITKIEQKSAKENCRDKKQNTLDLKNLREGAMIGIFAPVAMIKGGIVGAPIYAAAINIIKYLHSDNENNKKTFNNFFKSLKDNKILNTLLTAGVAAIAYKKANYSKLYIEKECKKTVKYIY